MICTNVIPCLSSGLAKNNKIMPMFVPFSLLFLGHFESLVLFSRMGTNLTPKQSISPFFSQVFLVNFSKVQGLTNNFSIF